MQIEINKHYRSIKTGNLFAVDRVHENHVYGQQVTKTGAAICRFAIPVSAFIDNCEPADMPTVSKWLAENLKSVVPHLQDITPHEMWVDICDQQQACERHAKTAFDSGNVTSSIVWQREADELESLVDAFEPHPYTGPNN